VHRRVCHNASEQDEEAASDERKDHVSTVTRTYMTDLLFKLASAIASEEGFFGGDPNSRPRRDHNPGDLRAAPWLQHPKHDGGFWAAGSDAEGIGGLYHQIALDIARGMTLRQLIYAWAPPVENNSVKYLEDAMRRVGITAADTPLWNFLDIVSLP